ncbi:hypothetical protein FRC07_005977 [Ceratobasidium sp. 392]|nr:hypothetical protein FRC07_005977 [Ceratobasidium sp. 392]
MAAHDSLYYFSDRSIVLQVEDVLFKIEISRLANHSEVFRDMLELPSSSDGAEGTSDGNPVRLPQIKAEEFRSLLYIFYHSNPMDPEFLSFMSGASQRTNHTPAKFKRYLDIAKLSRQFCMSGAEEWARKQIQEFVAQGSSANWLDPTHALATHSYAKLCSHDPDDEFVQDASSTLDLTITRCTDKVLLEFFKTLPTDADLALQGLLFASMLSRGHKSSLWRQVTWTERAVLYAGQVHLTPLPNFPPLSSLRYPETFTHTVIDQTGEQSRSCHACLSHVRSTWSNALPATDWSSDAPLRGVALIVKLPGVMRDLRNIHPHEGCTKWRGLVMAKFYALIRALFVEVTKLRNGFSDQ